MRTTTRAGLATSTLIGLVAAPALTLSSPAAAVVPAEPQVAKERGIVLECSGTLRGQDVLASVYENDTYGNVLAVSIGDPDHGGAFNGKDTETSLWAGRTVKAGLKVGGKRATVSGLAKKVGPKRAVHDEFDDDGQHIVADGFHRRLRTDLELRYGGRTTPLTCTTAFFYDLTVTKEDLA